MDGWHDLHPAGALQSPQRGRETGTYPYADANHDHCASDYTGFGADISTHTNDQVDIDDHVDTDDSLSIGNAAAARTERKLEPRVPR